MSIQNLAHAFKYIGCWKAPGYGLHPVRKYGNGIEHRAEGCKEKGQHPGKHFDSVAPIDDSPED